MNKFKMLTVILALVMIGAAARVIFHKDVWDKNEDLLKENVLALGPSVDSIDLREVTPFTWDIAYSFPPYTSKESIYQTVGYKWDRISETVNEGMNQIVFMKEGKVVCYLYGYPENNGYGISLSDRYKGTPTTLRAEDNLTLKVNRNNGVVYLE